MEDSEDEVLRVLWRRASHLLSRLRAWMIKLNSAAFAGVDLDFLLRNDVRSALLVWIISGILLATSAAVLFFAISKCRPQFLLRSFELSRIKQM